MPVSDDWRALDHIASPNSGIMVQAPEPQAIHAQSILAKPAKKRKALGCHEETTNQTVRAHNRSFSVSTIGLCCTVAAHADNRLTSCLAYLLSSVVFILVQSFTQQIFIKLRVGFLFAVHVPHRIHNSWVATERAYFLSSLPFPSGCIFTHNQLSFSDILNRLKPVLSPQTKDTSRGFCRTDPRIKQSMLDTCPSIFSPQYHLLNVLNASSIQGSNERPEFIDREK